jgi:hypothetical protein
MFLHRFLLSNGMLMTSFFTNYRGAPFMEGLFENKALLIMLGGTQVVTFLAASGQSPDLNEVRDYAAPRLFSRDCACALPKGPP